MRGLPYLDGTRQLPQTPQSCTRFFADPKGFSASYRRPKRNHSTRHSYCGRVTTQSSAVRLCNVELVQLLSLRPPRLRHVVRTGLDFPALHSLRQAIVGLAARREAVRAAD